MNIQQKLHLSYYVFALLSVLLFILGAVAIVEVGANADASLVQQYLIALLLALLVIILAEVVFGYFISTSLIDIEAIKQLTEVASDVSKGNMDLNVEVPDQQGEIRDLAESFSRMVTSIKILQAADGDD